MHTYSHMNSIGKLWEESFTPAQLQGGFRACGIFPVNRLAIPDSKLAISVPFSSGPSSACEGSEWGTTQATCYDSTVNSTATATATMCTVLDLKCNDCGRCLTPIRMHVVAYFTQHLQKDPATKKRQSQAEAKILQGGADKRRSHRKDGKRRGGEAKGKEGKRKKFQRTKIDRCESTDQNSDHGESNGTHSINRIHGLSILPLAFAQMKMKNVVKNEVRR